MRKGSVCAAQLAMNRHIRHHKCRVADINESSDIPYLLILAATEAMACNPEAHCLFTPYTGTVSGIPASNIAMRLIVAPAPVIMEQVSVQHIINRR